MSTKQEKVVEFQYPQVKCEEGSWLRLTYNDETGKQKHAQGIVVAAPELIIMCRKPNRTIVIPFGNVVSIDSYAPKRIVEEWEKEGRAREMAKVIRDRKKRVDKIIGYHNFMDERERQIRKAHKLREGKARESR